MEFVGHTISGSPGSSPSSDDEGWQDDVAEDLNTFVRLSKAGHFTRAEDFFRAFLESYAGDFAVAAQYAENLIEQGSFGSAEKFLTAWLLKDVNVNVEERTVVRLFLGTARIYTRSEEREAARNDYAATCLQSVGQVLIAEDMSPLKLQTVIISLRLMDLASRARQTKRPPPFNLPFKLDRKLDQDPTWEEVTIALLNHGHIWEANTLLAIYLRHTSPKESELIRILDSVPDEDDTMYDLVRLTMLVLCSRSLLRQSRLVLMASGVFARCEECAMKLRFRAMDGITDPIYSSRAYQDFQLLSLEVEDDRPPHTVRWSSVSVLQDIQDQGNYMLLLAGHEQFARWYPIPVELLQATGASRGAIAELHPSADLAGIRDLEDWKAAPVSAMTPNSGPQSLRHVM